VNPPNRRILLVFLALLLPPIILTCLAFMTLAKMKTSDLSIDIALEVTPTAAIGQPDLALTKYKEGVTYHVQGNYSQAESTYLAALEADPDSGIIYNALGILYIDTDRPAEALLMFSQAVQVEPDIAEWWRNLGVVQANQGYLDQAVFSLETAIRLDPYNQVLYSELNLIYTQLERK
jgi:tetratricopeptide (TPR) repeat protein